MASQSQPSGMGPQADLDAGRNAEPSAALAAFAFFVGKRTDGKGWDLLIKKGPADQVTAWAAYGPFRLRREALCAFTFGDFRNMEPHNDGG
jgi:hypothetical protein